MRFLKIMYYDADILKTGKISKHSRKTKNKIYLSGKLHLPSKIPIGTNYTLLEFDEVEYQNMFDKKTKLKGYLLLLGEVKPD